MMKQASSSYRLSQKSSTWATCSACDAARPPNLCNFAFRRLTAEPGSLSEPSAADASSTTAIFDRLPLDLHLSQGQDIRDTALIHAEHLRHHCAACNQWMMDKNTVKTHILRQHASAWFKCNPTIKTSLETFRSLMTRDAQCPLCLKTVYGTSRHLLQCPVAMQMAFMLRMQALGVEVHEAPILRASLNCELAQRLLQDLQFAAASEHTLPLLLQQRCYLCNSTTVDAQSWKRHMRQHHSKLWAQQESRIAPRLRQLTFGRPCPFCKTEYQKTPAVHATTCLPLLQL